EIFWLVVQLTRRARSNPAQKLEPAPVITTTLSALSASALFKAPDNCLTRSGWSELLFSGRFRVSVRMAPSRRLNTRGSGFMLVIAPPANAVRGPAPWHDKAAGAQLTAPMVHPSIPIAPRSPRL